MTPNTEQTIRAAVDGLVAALLNAMREERAAARPDVERLLSIPAAAEALGGLARSTVYQEIGAGRLRSVTCRRRRMVPASAIAEYVAAAAERGAH